MENAMLQALVAELDWQLPEGVRLVPGAAEGFSISCDGKTATLTYKTNVQLARGLAALKQYGTDRAYEHAEASCFDDLGIMLDCSRNGVPTVDAVKRLLRVLALMGYDHLMLYTEDTYEIEGEPYFGYLRGRYTKAEMKEIDAYARSLDIEIIPCMQTLAHLGAIFHWRTYDPILDCADIMQADNEKTYALIDRMFATLSECFTSRRIHIGMDEAHLVGLGKYLDQHGYVDRFDLLTRHLSRVCEIAAKYGYHPMMWSDMFFRLANHGEYYVKGQLDGVPDGIREKMPKDLTLVYWDYYSDAPETYVNMMREHGRFGCPVWFAGGAWKWTGFAPENWFSIERTGYAVKASRSQNMRHMTLTCWGDNGAECSIYALLPTLYTAAADAYGITNKKEMEAGFRSFTGLRFSDFMALDDMGRLVEGARADENPCKYLLYNDVLLGQFDKTVADHREDIASRLDAALRALNAGARSTRYGYLFRTHKALARIMKVKYDLGLRLREAYRAGDREALAACAKDCLALAQPITRFRATFREQWMLEYKPHGFDVQDLRLGALIGRLRGCAETVEDYLTGKIDAILELEEDILRYDSRPFGGWANAATANRI